MPDVKRDLLLELGTARKQLWTSLEGPGEQTELYPGWKKREFLAHIAGWEAMMFDIFYRHVSRLVPKHYDYPGEDSANARFVSVRASTTVEDAMLECEINRFALEALLNSIDDFDETIALPWGVETVAQFVRGSIDHERKHAADILKVTEQMLE